MIINCNEEQKKFKNEKNSALVIVLLVLFWQQAAIKIKKSVAAQNRLTMSRLKDRSPFGADHFGRCVLAVKKQLIPGKEWMDHCMSISQAAGVKVRGV